MPISACPISDTRSRNAQLARVQGSQLAEQTEPLGADQESVGWMVVFGRSRGWRLPIVIAVCGLYCLMQTQPLQAWRASNQTSPGSTQQAAPKQAAPKQVAPKQVSQKLIKAAVKRIPYKSVGDVKLQLHVFNPPQHQAQDKRPAIVFFFGGGWVGGTPEQFYKQAWYLSQRGMVAICAEYRVRSKHKTSPRECVQDGKSAIRFVRANAARLGIDPARIVAAGGSAGGQVAAATATLSKFNEPGEDTSISSRPCALVLFNPVLDNGPDGWGHQQVKAYWRDISPLHNVKRPAPPALFMLGSQDKLLPVEVAYRYQLRVADNGGVCEVQVAQGQGHGYFNRGEPFLMTLERVDQFLVKHSLLTGPSRVRQWMEPLVKADQAKPKKKKRPSGKSKSADRQQLTANR